MTAHQAVPHMTVEKTQRDLVEGGSRRVDLGHDVNAVSILFNHPGDAANLTLDPREAVQELRLRSCVAACRGHRRSSQDRS